MNGAGVRIFGVIISYGGGFQAMNLNEFFSSPAVSLPRDGFEMANCTFDAFLKKLFSDYIAEVKKIDDPEHQAIWRRVEQSIPEIERIASRIAEATKHYLQGYPHQAYLEIKNTLKNGKFDNLITQVSSYNPAAKSVPFDFHLEAILHPFMYRMRPDFRMAAAGTLKKKDIFHVPFEKRNLVTNARYSIAGLPCLYLGSSTWICWEELNRPELNGCIFSKFKFAEKTNILDFQFPPANAWKLYIQVRAFSRANQQPARIDEFQARYNEAFVTSNIVYWPLIAACSIRVESRMGAFFPQYIVPQLLLQWVTKERKVDGIRYFSTRAATDMNFYVNVNYVFPTRDIRHSGRCSTLRRKIHLMTPVLWAMLELVKDPRDWTGSLPGAMDNRVGLVELSDSMKFPYADTKFYDLEKRFMPTELGDGFGPVEA